VNQAYAYFPGCSAKGSCGEQRLREKVVRPLHGLRVAPFYGCHIRRPATVYGAAGSDEASSLERLCEIVGVNFE
jgi:succinate dehydrogenase / fumarate reductase cytochrome b subunit